MPNAKRIENKKKYYWYTFYKKKKKELKIGILTNILRYHLGKQAASRLFFDIMTYLTSMIKMTDSIAKLQSFKSHIQF